jgi:hypothetical protein
VERLLDGGETNRRASGFSHVLVSLSREIRGLKSIAADKEGI